MGKINGKWSSLNFAPISYLYTDISLEEQAALYAAADVALLTPLREGMNLVCVKRLVKPLQAGHVLMTHLIQVP